VAAGTGGCHPARTVVLHAARHRRSAAPTGGEIYRRRFSEPLPVSKKFDGIELKTGIVLHPAHVPVNWTSSYRYQREFAANHGSASGEHGVSVDQFIASQLTGPPSYSSIELGLGCGGLHPATRMIYTAPAMPRSPLDSPDIAFNALFGTISPDQEQAAKDAKRRKSVLDNSLADFGARRATLSAKDKLRLDAHADSIRELELSLTAVCDPPDAPTGVDSETSIDRQSDLIASAFGCGLTRVASMQVRIADNDNAHPWSGSTVAVTTRSRTTAARHRRARSQSSTAGTANASRICSRAWPRRPTATAARCSTTRS
jgi:hypothetical protein